jgi:regulator of protease activity HflC (stomatin/prohibitin superfamily)
LLWIIFTLVLAVIGFGGFFIALGSTGRERLGPLAATAACAVVWLVVTIFMSIHAVGQREVGIVYNFSGTISGGKRDPGLIVTWPWQHIRLENVGIQSEEFDLDASNAAVSADQQPIFARLFVNFQVEPVDVIGLYKRVGPAWKHILLDARVLQDFKEVTSEYETPELTTHRAEVRKTTRERLAAELAPYDVKIVDVFLKNVGFSDAYTRAVEQKQVQVQQALQAEAKVAQSTAEAQQKVAQARGDATAIELKGRALRSNPEILQLEAIDKLNPNAQLVICTGKTCPSLLPTSVGLPARKGG